MGRHGGIWLEFFVGVVVSTRFGAAALIVPVAAVSVLAAIDLVDPSAAPD